MKGCASSKAILIEYNPLPEHLPQFFDDGTLSGFIGVKRKTLWACFYEMQRFEGESTKDIRCYRIPKNSGGHRTVYALSSYLQRVNRLILHKVLDPLQETLGDHVTAYRKGRGIPQAIRRHLPPCALCDTHRKGVAPPKHSCLRHGTYIRMDLEDFFHSVRRSHVRNTLLSFGYNEKAAVTLSGLLAMPLTADKRDRPRTPQGFATSGAICNLVADKFLDTPILAFLEELNVELGLENFERFVYSRYADDMSITCGVQLQDLVVDRIKKYVSDTAWKHGFRINKKKTKTFQGTYRKKLLGGSFARKLTVPKKEYREFRAILHNCKTHGIHSQLSALKKETEQEAVMYLKGRLGWFRELDPVKTAPLECVLNELLSDGRGVESGA